MEEKSEGRSVLNLADVAKRLELSVSGLQQNLYGLSQFLLILQNVILYFTKIYLKKQKQKKNKPHKFACQMFGFEGLV